MPADFVSHSFSENCGTFTTRPLGEKNPARHKFDAARTDWLHADPISHSHSIASPVRRERVRLPIDRYGAVGTGSIAVTSTTATTRKLPLRDVAAGTVSYAYDNLDRLSQTMMGVPTESTLVIDYTYDALGPSSSGAPSDIKVCLCPAPITWSRHSWSMNRSCVRHRSRP